MTTEFTLTLTRHEADGQKTEYHVPITNDTGTLPAQVYEQAVESLTFFILTHQKVLLTPMLDLTYDGLFKG